MVMLKPAGKAQKIAEKILKQQGIKATSTKKNKKMTLLPPYLQH